MVRARGARRPGAVRWLLGRIGARLLIVNLLVLLVPVAGLEFARLHERQLLASLERDMRDQCALARALVEDDLTRGVPIGDPRHARILTDAARRTRTRVRLLDAQGATLVDSHENGPPEGPEPPPPHMLTRGSLADISEAASREATRYARWDVDAGAFRAVPDRPEVRAALAGEASAHTRLRDRPPGVFLFLGEPIRQDGAVIGAVYTVRSTRPVLVELYRIRSGLMRVLAVAVFLTALVTMLLALSISRPLARLSRAARRVSAGEPGVTIPASGGGEIAELGRSFATMKERLDARLRYISDFAADVAHEFKSPLTSIRGAAELLGEGAADEPAARARFLRNIELDVERLDRLVSRLLELSRIEASSEAMTLVDLEALLARVASRASSPDQPVVVDFQAPQRLVLARESDLETALLNLLDNAVRFSPAFAVVRVSASGGPERVTVTIRDEGPGISPQNLPRIFDRFFTTDAARDGTGLGLSIVKAVAEAHGGDLRAESAPGQGATFILTLPARR
jgi:two-component system, OmpR family, sensor histidine kinase ChvG